MNGPIPSGEKEDRGFFCGGKQETPEKEQDQSALYFQLKGKQKGLADQAYEGIAHKVTVKGTLR